MNRADLLHQVEALQERLGCIVQALGASADSPTVPRTEARDLLDISRDLNGVMNDLAENSRSREESPNPILRVDGEGVVLYANDAAKKLLREWNCCVGARAPEGLRATVSDVLTDRLSRIVQIDCSEHSCSFAAAPIPTIGCVDLYALDIGRYGPVGAEPPSEAQDWQDKFAMEHGDPDALAGEDTGHTVLRGTETILLVEDESHLRKFILKSLQERGFKVLEAAKGEEAIRIAESRGDIRIDLVLTDIVMPVMGGYDLARNLGVSMPEIKVLFMSGYPGEMAPARGVPGGKEDLVQKPFTPDELVARIRVALDREKDA